MADLKFTVQVVLLLAVILANMTVQGKRYSQDFRCEPIRSDFCGDLPYNWTIASRTPEIRSTILTFNRMLGSLRTCPHLMSFLCGFAFPRCNPVEAGPPQPPCRSTCLKARMTGCGRRMIQEFGFEFPEILQCSNFPESGSCLHPQDFDALQAGRNISQSGSEHGHGPQTNLSSSVSPTPGVGYYYNASEANMHRPGANLTEVPTPVPAVWPRGHNNRGGISHSRHSSCEPIVSEVCRDLPYAWTSFPNFLKITRAQDAELVARQMSPVLRQMEICPYVKPFMCGALYPRCSPKEGGPTQFPCASMCRRAVEECISQFGLEMPGPFHCSNFPESGSCLTIEDFKALRAGRTNSSNVHGPTVNFTTFVSPTPGGGYPHFYNGSHGAGGIYSSGTNYSSYPHVPTPAPTAWYFNKSEANYSIYSNIDNTRYVSPTPDMRYYNSTEDLANVYTNMVLNPFMRLLNSSLGLAEAQKTLAKEQTLVAKLARKKLNLEIWKLKREKAKIERSGRPMKKKSKKSSAKSA